MPKPPPRSNLPATLDELDHHAAKGFRLTAQSAGELIAAVVLLLLALLFGVLAFNNFRFTMAMSEAALATAMHDTETGPKSARAAADANPKNVYAVLLLGKVSVDAGDFAAATEAYSRMGDDVSEFPEIAIGRAVALLSDPATAADEAARGRALSLFQTASGDPNAQIALGQFALDAGDYAAAESQFRSALAADPPPTAWASAVARNGIGLCKLQGDHARFTSEEFWAAFGEFQGAIAYRQPFAPPLVNRDRAAAMFLRAVVRESAGDSTVIKAAMEKLATAFDLRRLDSETVSIDLRRYSTDTKWRNPVTLNFRTEAANFAGEIGRVDQGPLTENRRRYLLNAVGIANSVAGMTTANDADRAAAFKGATTLFQAASERDAKYLAPKYNELATAVRRYLTTAKQNERRAAFSASTLRLFDLFIGNLDAVPAAEHAPLLVARYVSLSEMPQASDAKDLDNAANLAKYLVDSALLDRIETAGGPRAPSTAWLDFQRENLAAVHTFFTIDTTVGIDKMEPGPLAKEAGDLVAAAMRFAAHLPIDTAPAGTGQINDPASLGRGPVFRKPVAFHEVALLARLYEPALELASNAVYRVADRTNLPATQRTDFYRLCRDLARTRLRIAGFMELNDASFLGRTDASTIAARARQMLTNVDKALGPGGN